jgi:enediyne biosynthesis protein E4
LTGSRRQKAIRVAGILVLAVGGVWVYKNSSLIRLRREFIPWMHRLERWRDSAEETRRALKRRDSAASDPAGIARLRDWAWHGLDRIAWISYRVEKPEHEVSADREVTRGRVRFTVGGFRPDGSRVERNADAILSAEWDPRRDPTPRETPEGPPPEAIPVPVAVTVSFDRAVAERSNATPRFRDATAQAGLGAPRRDPELKLTNRLIAGIWPGSGVAVLDFDGDGAEDLFVADGVRSILYRNDGRSPASHDPQDERPRAAAVHFTDVTVAAGLATPDGKGIAATGVAAGDVDGDGFPDLFVTDAFGRARLFRNRGNGTFEETTDSSGIRIAGNARSAAFADVDGDGDLDLFVCVAGDYYNQMPDPPYDANDGKRNYLFLNDGRGHFTDASAAWGIEKATRWSLSSLFADYDGDGRPDLLVTNDFGFKNLYRNDAGRRFEDVTKKAGVEVRAYGMSGAWADFDGDGLLDLYTTGTDTQWWFLHDYPGLPIGITGRAFLPVAIRWVETMTRGNSLLLQKPDHTFADATARSGASRAGWNWSSIAADLDNDSWPDIYSANGMWGDGRDHDRELEFWWQTLAYWDDYVAGRKTFDRKGAGIAGIERDRFFRNLSGENSSASADPIFEERSFLEGLDLETNGRAVVAFDANGDGALDLYIRSVQAPEALFLGSRRPGEHFLRIRLRGTPGRDNRDGIGSRITAVLPNGRRIVLETGNASGYLSTGSPIAHLGLGPAARIDSLTIRWPSGKLQNLGHLDTVDRTIVVDEERGIVP